MVNILKYINDDFLFILITLPILTLIISVIGQIIFQKKTIVIGIIFLIYIMVTFTIYNSTFLFWVLIYTIIATIGTLLVDLIIMIKKRFNLK